MRPPIIPKICPCFGSIAMAAPCTNNLLLNFCGITESLFKICLSESIEISNALETLFNFFLLFKIL